MTPVRRRNTGLRLSPELRMGMRLQAVWRPEGERKLSGGDRAWGGSGIDGAVSHFEPTGEPDASPERYKGYAI